MEMKIPSGAGTNLDTQVMEETDPDLKGEKDLRICDYREDQWKEV